MKRLIICVILALLVGMFSGIFIGYKHTTKCAPGDVEFMTYEKFTQMVSEELTALKVSAGYKRGIITTWHGSIIRYSTLHTEKVFAELNIDAMIAKVFIVEPDTFIVSEKWENIRPTAKKVAELISKHRFE